MTHTCHMKFVQLWWNTQTHTHKCLQKRLSSTILYLPHSVTGYCFADPSFFFFFPFFLPGFASLLASSLFLLSSSLASSSVLSHISSSRSSFVFLRASITRKSKAAYRTTSMSRVEGGTGICWCWRAHGQGSHREPWQAHPHGA